MKQLSDILKILEELVLTHCLKKATDSELSNDLVLMLGYFNDSTIDRILINLYE